MLLRLEVGFERGDQLTGHFDFAVGDLNVFKTVEQLHFACGDNLVGIHHRRNHQLAVYRANSCQVLLGAHDKAGNTDLPCFLHRGHQELVGLLSIDAWRQVVLSVVEDRVDVGEVDELLQIDCLHRLGIEGIELFGSDRDVLTVGQFKTLDDLFVGNLFAGDRRYPLLLDAAAGRSLDLVEAHVLTTHRAKELDRDVYQPEAH